MTNLSGKTALVTGASRGIGRAIARRLARDGVLVGIHYGSNEEAAKVVLAEIEQAGGHAFKICAALGIDGDVDTLFAGLEARLDGAPLDILVNNAGILDASPLAQVTAEAFDHSYAVNVRAPFFIIKRALPLRPNDDRLTHRHS